MGLTMDVNHSSFASEVIAKSYEKPVLVDFFAQWCGPCQMLKPILEKLAQEYDFVLAKVDIDQNPELANTYHVEGVPDVRVVSQGEVQPGFVGVLSEPQLRDFLAKLNLKSDLEVGLEQINQAERAGDIEQAKRLFEQLIQTYPQSRKLAIAAARFLIQQDRLESAEKLLASIQEHEREFYSQAQALKGLVQFKRESQNAVVDSDLDQQFLQAIHLTLAQDYETALQQFLEIVGRDRKYRNDGARKAMITIFDLLGVDHPLTRHYRKQLMQTLY